MSRPTSTFSVVGQIADDALERFRQLADQRRDRDDLMPMASAGSFIRSMISIFVAAGQMLLANLLQIGDRRNGFRRLSRHIKPKVVTVRDPSWSFPITSSRLLVGFTSRRGPRRRPSGSLPWQPGRRQIDLAHDSLLAEHSFLVRELRLQVGDLLGDLASLALQFARAPLYFCWRLELPARSLASCARRAEPVSTPSGPI